MITFDLLWQPIVLVNDPPELPPHVVAAGQLQIQPPNGQNLEDWWRTQLSAGVGDHVQGQLEFRLLPYLKEMQRAHQWHIPLHPEVAPATRDWLPDWNEDEVSLNLVYELPVDRVIDDWVWAEIELVRRAPRHGGRAPMVAGTHVGRQGLTVALADALNQSPFQVLLLDPEVTRDLSPVTGDPENDRRFDTVADFLQRLRPDIPVVATGVQHPAEWQALRALGLVYGQGSLWLPPTSLEDTFKNQVPAFDPEWFPGAIYPNAEDWAAQRGLTFETRALDLAMKGR